MPIDRAILQQHLMLAERHVAEGTEHVTRQRELVARLERDGHDVFESKRLLILFEELLDLHIADRERIERELNWQQNRLNPVRT